MFLVGFDRDSTVKFRKSRQYLVVTTEMFDCEVWPTSLDVFPTGSLTNEHRHVVCIQRSGREILSSHGLYHKIGKGQAQ